MYDLKTRTDSADITKWFKTCNYWQWGHTTCSA